MRKLFLLVVFLMFAIPLWATHQRAAEITYVWKGGNAYEFTLITYNVPNTAWQQRDSLLMKWGDGFENYVPRVDVQDMGNNTVRSIYKSIHHYATAGTYTISMEDANRNSGVVNVPNSVSVPMYIESELVINPFMDNKNNSVQLLNAPLDQGCVGRPFYHNPAAYDPDGDSLSYSLVPCRGEYGQVIPNYSFPQTSTTFEIDPITGMLRWENPVIQGEYNVAILIEEWHNGVKVGSVIRDMQILINACDNDLPQISAIDDTCVIAGTTLDFVIRAIDPDGDLVTLEVSGDPMELSQGPAVLTPPIDYGLNPAIQFTWQTACDHIRKTPYQVVIHAKDHASPVALSNIQTVSINVIGPPVENLKAELKNNTVDLAWDPYRYCQNVKGIRVYRKIGSNPYQPDDCETGVRPGYQLISQLGANATSYHDTNGGHGFEQGMEYSYRVVAVFQSDAESKPSNEASVMLPNNKPLMLQVSNDSTDLQGHQMMLGWARPRVIDMLFSAPFSYRLIRNLDGTETTVYSGMDSTFVDTEVNLSEAKDLSYKVEMKDVNQQLIGTSAVAHAVMLTGTPGDRTASLSWIEEVPWEIDSTEVFKKQDTVFVRVAVVNVMEYIDNQVDNDVEYQYYVRTYGHYSIAGLPRPLVNYSAVITVKLSDQEEPEPEVPIYELPNVFTPNDDQKNDVFVPIRITPDLITKVDMHIFNRWGRFVYETKDIFINWDGRVGGTGQPCSPGTYFYVCDVEMTTPEGPVTKRLQGSIMIVR